MARKASVSRSRKDGSPDPRTWAARDWDDLRSIWSELFPAADGPVGGPCFRGEPIGAKIAGYVFERWIVEAFRISGRKPELKVIDPYPSPPEGATVEQIDGLVFDGWQAFLIESKNWGKRVDFASLAKFHHVIERRPVGTFGLFFAPGGYTVPTLELVKLLRPIRVLLFDGQDLDRAAKQGDILAIVRRKWELAVQYGNPNLPAGETPR